MIPYPPVYPNPVREDLAAKITNRRTKIGAF